MLEGAVLTSFLYLYPKVIATLHYSTKALISETLPFGFKGNMRTWFWTAKPH